MEIKIDKPLRLQLDVVETDEHVPSMRMKIMIALRQYGHTLDYQGYAWFDCSVWDRFVTDMNDIGAEEAKLVDMGGYFTLSLGVDSGKSTIFWEMKKVDTSGAVATAAFHSPIDEDTLAHVKNQFAQFDRWW